MELLYYSYHIMVGLGTLFILMMGIARRCSCCVDRLATTRPMLWVLMLAFPFPYIATTAGWWTAELGRQPWIIHGLMRTGRRPLEARQPGRCRLHPAGLRRPVLLLGMLFVVQVLKEINRGPAASH